MATELLYEGKAKKVYKGMDEDTCIITYKDSATAFNGEKKAEITGKGQLNCTISNVIFNFLEENNIPTHFVSAIDETSILVKHVQIIPLEVIVRNVAAGSFSKNFGIAEGVPLNPPTLEFCYKNDSLGDPMINNSQIAALGIATEGDIAVMTELAFKINTLLTAFFKKASLKLIDFKIEFGRFKGKIILADEITPDCCRLWDADSNEKLDKDRFRRDLGGVEEAYQEVLRRLSNEDE